MPASAADDASSTSRSLPAASVAAVACGIAPHAHCDHDLGASYSGESDVSDLEKPVEASRSPAVPHSSKELSNERTRDKRHSLFDSDDEYSDYFDYSSPRSTRASSHERVDDGASRHHTGTRGTGKDTTLKRDELKPWCLPEQPINSLSHETSQHQRIP